MRKFQHREVKEAVAYALCGRQALHLHRIIVDWERAPYCFRAAINRGENIAHLFDQNIKRLRQTVLQLGVRVVVVEHIGTDNQHVDLCGKPLRRAERLCDLGEGFFDADD